MCQADFSIVRMIQRSVVCFALVVLLAGCADIVTYSRNSQREGLRLYREGDYANAAGAFKNSVRQNPRNYEGHYYLGASYQQMGQYEQAIAAYHTAQRTIGLTLQGKNDHETQQKIFEGLAGSIAMSDRRDAEVDALQADAQQNGKAQTWLLLAKIYANRGDADSALDAYNRASLLDPQSFLIAKEYGLYLERIGQRDRAIKPLERAYALNSQDEQVVAALRRIGVILGPSIKEESQLAKPILPKGPIPPLRVPGFGQGQPANTVPSAEPTVQAPRD